LAALVLLFNSCTPVGNDGGAERVAAPVFSTNGGPVPSGMVITVSCTTSGAKIYYTLDSSTPDATAGQKYESPGVYISGSHGEGRTLKAIAYQEGMLDSDVTTASFTIDDSLSQTDAPLFTIPGGIYATAQNVTFANYFPEIWYTLNGSVPSRTNGTQWPGGYISISSLKTLKAVAYSGVKLGSNVTTAVYNVFNSAAAGTAANNVIACAMARDASGSLHICYSTGAYLYYVTNASGSWATPVQLDFNALLSILGVTIAVDGTGTVHVCAYDDWQGDLYYYKGSGTSFSARATVDNSSPKIGQYPSLKVDSSNHLHVSYYDGGNGDLIYNYFNGTTWYAGGGELIADNYDVGKYSSLALDSTGGVHICYYDASNFDLKYVSGSSGNWSAPLTVDTGADSVGTFASMVLDQSNKAHISYYDATTSRVKYATNKSGSWVCAMVPSGHAIGAYATSMAIDAAGNVNVSCGTDGTQLLYATNLGGSWSEGILHEDLNVGKYSSILVDTLGYAHIAYSVGNSVYMTHND
jgi:hypothetical protein